MGDGAHEGQAQGWHMRDRLRVGSSECFRQQLSHQPSPFTLCLPFTLHHPSLHHPSPFTLTRESPDLEAVDLEDPNLDGLNRDVRLCIQLGLGVRVRVKVRVGLGVGVGISKQD